MNLFKSLVQAKDKCILDDSLFYDTIGHSDSLEELVCEKTFFFLLVSSGKAKIHIQDVQDSIHSVGKNDLLVIPASMTIIFQQLSKDYMMYCLALTPPFFHSLPSSQFLYGKLCEFVTRYSLAAIHLKNDASYYFKKTFTFFPI